MIATKVLCIDADSPAVEVIARATGILRAGGLVAFPTETVYGLGANALDADAVAKIFAAKGRPQGNPLIVHVRDASSAASFSKHWPDAAQQLAERFWPGPLTLVVNKSPVVPDIVTASGPTVALRVPAHKVALAILDAAKCPIAAPSANRSSRLSPTRAEHVLRDLEGHIDLILDAGPTAGGLESTVLDVTVHPPRLLRPGLVSAAEIESMIGPILRPMETKSGREEVIRSPGMLGRHYAPRTPLECVAESAADRVDDLIAQGLRVGWITFEEKNRPNVEVRIMPADAADYARQLYAVLHDLDTAGLDRIVVDMPPAGQEWLAIHDRLQRASM